LLIVLAILLHFDVQQKLKKYNPTA